MANGDLSLISDLKTSMRWHQARQKVLAQNVANADTPGYRGRDLKALPFAVAGGIAPPASPRLELERSNPAHLAGMTDTSEFNDGKVETFEVTPSGNAINLEEEMMKSSENQVDFQAVASLYQRSLGLLRKAIGKSS